MWFSLTLTVTLVSLVVSGGWAVKNLPANAGNTDSIPGFGRSPGEGDDNPFQYSCLGNPMDWGAWQANSLWGHERVGHEWVTKHQQNILWFCFYWKN